MKRISFGFALCVGLSSFACQGVTTPGDEDTEDPPGMGGSTGNGGMGAPSSPPLPESCQKAEDKLIRDRALSRLTPVQYRNTLATLVGSSRFTPPELPTQPSPLGFAFSNHIKSQVVNQPVVEAFSQAAYDTSLAIAGNLNDFAPCSDGAHSACGKAFISGFGKRAFRRPLSEEEAERYQSLFESALEKFDYKTAVQMTAEAFLSAPQFLYLLGDGDSKGSGGKLSPWQVASQLSFLLTNNMPDDLLMEAAESGQLLTNEGLRKQAKRLLESEAGRATTMEFMGEWLNVAAYSGVSKDGQMFPDFGPDDVEALRTSFLKTVEHSLAVDGTLSGLLTSRTFVLDKRTAPLVGLDDQAIDGFEPVNLAEKELGSQRSGLLTHPGWLAVHAHDTVDAPVIRGLFVFERLLCQPAPPVPDNVPSLMPAEGKMTARMALEQTHHVPGCVECHSFFDPYGFAFGNYDAIGRYRETDSGFPVDAKVDLPEPLSGGVENAIELSETLASSANVQRCFAVQVFRRTFGRLEDEDQDRCAIDSMSSALVAGQGNIAEMIISLVASDAFVTSEPEAP